ncbi:MULTISPECIES: hypothetical protein [Nostocales]|uniref:Uncharacterized protein n=3 Tax=Nostocales TaxID=1161 RepID=A0A8S9TDI5_9CYAN|nr:hypothetical protein [Tolypothrix bouteillei]KAF3890385.1 hypothetical protein DA73_0400036765 [Tolypothrix bouteillei VB521301]
MLLHNVLHTIRAIALILTLDPSRQKNFWLSQSSFILIAKGWERGGEPNLSFANSILQQVGDLSSLATTRTAKYQWQWIF